MSHLHRQKGRAAENVASHWLRNQQYTILARNIKFFGTEIDILAKSADSYTFFEVKHTRSTYYRQGFPLMGYRQKLKYQQAIDRWQEDTNKVYNISVKLVVVNEYLKPEVMIPLNL